MLANEAQKKTVDAVYDNAIANRIVFYDASGKVISDESRSEFHPFRDAFKVDLPTGCERYDVCMNEPPLWTGFAPKPASNSILKIESFSFAATSKSESEGGTESTPDRSSVIAVLRSIANGELEHADIPRDKAAEALEIAVRAQALVEFCDYDEDDW